MPARPAMPSATIAPTCPRCGYDQSGGLKPADPLPPDRGRCPECGLDFDWADILDPQRRKIHWFYEHEPWIFRALAALFVTFARTLIPWRFWRTVALTHRPVVRRLLLALPILHLCGALTGLIQLLLGARTSRLYLPHWTDFAQAFAPLGFQLSTFPNGRDVYLSADTMPPATAAMLGLGLGYPVALLVLSKTLARARVRWTHLLRATVYSCGGSIVSFAAISLLATLESALQPAWGSGPPSRLARAVTLVFVTIASSVWPTVLACLWLCVWWFFSLHLGLKLPAAWRDWLLATALAVLTAYIAYSAHQILLLRGAIHLFP